LPSIKNARDIYAEALLAEGVIDGNFVKGVGGAI